jgi:hypothetical protein
MASRRNKHRTYARNRAVSRKGYLKYTESDGQYLLKLVVIIILATIWVKFTSPLYVGVIPFGGVPVGMLLGLILVSRVELFQYDKKIWYAILMIVTILTYFVPAGIVI